MAGGILVVLFLLSSAGVDAADDNYAATAVVRIDNLVPVPADYLAFAQSRAAEVFSRIGVHVTWIDEQTAVRDHVRPPFTVVLIKSGPELSVRSGVVDALGFAAPSVSRAHIVYDRIVKLAPLPATMLGDVIAHELGHLLLPSPGHSARGIMRPGVDVQLRPIETFTDPQARQIVARLSQIRLSRSDDRSGQSDRSGGSER